MGIDKDQLRTYVVRPCLGHLGLWSEAAENLLMGTAAQESHMGTYLHQIKGPALGIYQCEPATHQDIHENFLNYKAELSKKVINLLSANDQSPVDQLSWNLWYATAICRVHYLRAKGSLPEAGDVAGMAAYWKNHYNTSLGRGTPKEFVANYKRLVE